MEQEKTKEAKPEGCPPYENMSKKVKKFSCKEVAEMMANTKEPKSYGQSKPNGFPY